jgi:Tfp pilus assembly protein PilV
MTPLQSQQRGLSMIGFLFVAVMLVAVAMLAMKLVPAYI